MAEFTKGPWVYEHDKEADRHFVCHGETTCDATTVVEVTLWKENAEANGRLIAEAPEMHNQLNNVLDLLHVGRFLDEKSGIAALKAIDEIQALLGRVEKKQE